MPQPDRDSTHGAVARRAAAELLVIVLEDRKTMDQALLEAPSFLRLEGRDRAFARAMASTALRYLGPIDAALATLLSRPLPDNGEGAQNLLRIGAAQIAILGTPIHAAVGATVEAAKSWRQTFPFAGLINAVLRRLSRESVALIQNPDPDLILPGWLMARWRGIYGAQNAQILAKESLQEAPLDLTLKDPQSAAHWAQELGAVIRPSGSLRLTAHSGTVTELPGFAQGAYWVQDETASVPAKLLRVKTDARVLDVCGAPGGKSLQLAAQGCRLTVLDQARPKLDKVKENFARVGLSADIKLADARRFTSDTPFDAILVDAPCLATGTLRRHPEAAWIKDVLSLEQLVASQRQILDNCLRQLARGGTLVYSVCSREPEEGREQIAWALARDFGGECQIGVDLISKDEVPGLEHFVTPEGYLDTNQRDRSKSDRVEGTDPTDGFFVARLRRY